MRVLIDADVVVFKAGFGAQASDPEPPLSHSLHNCRNLLKSYVSYLQEHFDVDEVVLYLSSDDKSNFRYEVAVTQPYKGNRVNMKKPIHYTDIKEYMVRKFKAVVVTGIEADDAMGIEACRDPDNTIIVSLDKDMRMIPCWHWETTDKEPYFVEDPGYLKMEETPSGTKKLFGTGMAWFYAQMLMGDSADHIPGVGGVGPVGAHKLLKQCETEEDYETKVKQVYKDKGLSEDRYNEIRRLLWIHRKLTGN